MSSARAASNPRSNGPGGAPADGRRLIVREAQVLSEHKGGAPVRVQTVHEVTHHAGLAGIRCGLLTVKTQRGAVHIPSAPSMAAAQLVHRCVPGDGQQPGPGGRVAPEPGQAAHGANERVLGEVVSALAVDERGA